MARPTPSRFRRVAWGSTLLALAFLAVLAAVLRLRGRGELRASLTDPYSLCDGTPILVEYPDPGPGGPFEECAFQCGLLPSYFIVYADVDAQTGHLRAQQCGKDPVLHPGSQCNDVQGGVDGACDSGMVPASSPTVDVLFRGALAMASSAAAESAPGPDATAWHPATGGDESSAGAVDVSSAGAGASSEVPVPGASSASVPSFPLPGPASGRSSFRAGSVPRCGNGIVEQAEECDAGARNGVPGSFCTGACRRMAGCGNEVIDPGEQCDEGAQNGSADSPCTALCILAPGILPRCGDGILEAGEECDEAARNGASGSPCTAQCRFAAGHAAGLTANILPSGMGGVAQTGPATVAVMAAGAAAGYAWIKRRRRR